MEHPYIQLQEGLQRLPAQCPTRRPSVTRLRSHISLSRTSMCPFVQEGVGEALPEPPTGYWSAWKAQGVTCAHSPGTCRWLTHARTDSLALCCVPRWEQVHIEHVWQAWKSLEMPRWMLRCLWHHTAWLIWWWVRRFLGGLHRPPRGSGSLTAVRYHDCQNLCWCSRLWFPPCTQQWAHVAPVCRQSLVPSFLWPQTVHELSDALIQVC